MEEKSESSSEEDDWPLKNFTDTISKVKKALKISNETEILPSNLKVIDINNDEQKTLQTTEKAKILLIKNVATIPHFLEIIKHENVSNFIKNSPNCFILIAEVAKNGLIDLTNFLEFFNESSFTKRPFLLQIKVVKEKDSEIFLKSKDEINFTCCKLKDVKIKEKHFVSQICSGKFSFDMLLNALSSGICGKFDENILTCRIDINKKFSGLKLMELAVDSGDAMLVRFLRLFSTEIDLKILERVVKNSSFEIFRAFLDFPVVDDRHPLRVDDNLIEILAGNEGKFFHLAAEYGNCETLEFLLRLNLFKKAFDEALKLSECALKAKNFNNLLLLLKNDFPFPKNFEEASKTCVDLQLRENLENLSNKRKTLHEGIRAKNKQIVEKFVEEFSEIQIGYAPNNQTALETALETAVESNDFKIYAFLLYNRFSSDSQAYQTLLKSLSNPQKEEITKTCQSFYGRPCDSHIFFLYSKTRLGLDYDKSKQKLLFERIKGYLDRLNQMPEIVPILKVIENSYYLIIVFDFDRDSVEKIDMKSSDTTLGVCYAKSGRIYIGARTSEGEVLGTLIHELCHYAMEIVFENGSKPFYLNDLEGMARFFKIIKSYKKIKNDGIVQRVFNCYESEDYCAEMIVRVPEMIAFYHENQTHLKILRKIYEKLFTYYQEDVNSKILEFIENFETFKSVREIQQINDRLGNLRGISEIKLKPFDFSIIDKTAPEPPTQATQPESKSLELFITEIPEFTVSSIIERLKTEKNNLSGSTIVLNSRDLENDFIIQSITSTYLITKEVTLVVNFEDLKEIPDKALTLLDCENSPRIVFLVCKETFDFEALKRKLFGRDFLWSQQRVSYNWSDLSLKMKEKVLKTKVFFQDYEILLQDLMEIDSKVTDFLPLASLLNKSEVKFGSSVEKSEGYDLEWFIERNLFNKAFDEISGIDGEESEESDSFHQKSTEIDSRNFENFMNKVKDRKIVIISDEAGMGKSTILTHVALMMKENYQDNWIVRIDLHKHIDEFKTDKDGSEYESDYDSDFGSESVDSDGERTEDSDSNVSEKSPKDEKFLKKSEKIDSLKKKSMESCENQLNADQNLGNSSEFCKFSIENLSKINVNSSKLDNSSENFRNSSKNSSETSKSKKPKLTLENTSDIRDFISQNFAKTSSNFEHNLFLEIFNNSKVILLLDGLDEISPFCENEFRNFFAQLKLSSIKQVWVTTRPNLRRKIEEDSGEVAWELKPFSKENQVDFITKYWKNKLKFPDSPDLHLYLKTSAEKLIKHVSQSIKDESLNLIGIPLQARMIADIFFDTVKRNLKQESLKFEMPKRFDILWLYKKFMTQKIVITTKEKGVQILTEKARNDLDGVDMVKIHEKLAVNLILVKEESDRIVNDNIKPNPKLYEVNIDKDQLQRFGVVSFDFNGKPFFIHRTFAEFFVAMFIFKILSSEDLSMIKEVTKLIVLLQSRSNNTIRTFMDCAIKESTSVQENVKIQKKIGKSIKQLKLKDFDFLRYFSCMNKTFLVKFLIDCTRFCEKSVAVASLQAREEESVLHVTAAKGNRALFEEAWKVFEAKMDRAEIEGVFMKSDYNDWNVFLLAYHRVFACQIDYLMECLRFDQLKKVKSLEISKDFYEKNSLLMKIFEKAKEFLGVDRLEELIPEFYMIGTVPYQFTGGTPEYPRTPITSTFAKKHLKVILNNRFSIAKTIYQNKTELEIMTEKDNLFTNFLTFFVDSTRELEEDGRILEIFHWIHKKFLSKEVMSFAIDQLLMKAFCKVKQEKSAIEIMEIIKLHFTEDEFCEFLLNHENLYQIHMYTFEPYFKAVINFPSKVFTPKELQSFLLNDKIYKNRKLLNHLAKKRNSSKKLIKYIFKIMRKRFTSHEIFNIFKSSVCGGKLLTNFFVEHSTKEKLAVYLNFIKETLSRECQKQLVAKNEIRNCFYVEHSSEILEIVLNYVEYLYDEEEFVELLEGEESLFYYAPWRMVGRKTFEDVFAVASRYLDEDSLKAIVEKAQPTVELKKFLHLIS